MKRDKNSNTKFGQNAGTNPIDELVKDNPTESNSIELPTISVPKEASISGLEEKFSVNAVNGSSNFSVPIPISKSRGLSPELSISYSSSQGNSIFGVGWNLDLPTIKRSTNRKLPEYHDQENSDEFILSGFEDLVPCYSKDVEGRLILDGNDQPVFDEILSDDRSKLIRRYQPRTEGSFSRILRIYEKDTGVIKWKITSRENVTTLYGWSDNSRISDPSSTRIFEWLPEFSYDDTGNCIKYVFRKEDDLGLDLSLPSNRNRIANGILNYTNRYLTEIYYGNKTPYERDENFNPNSDFLFSLKLDYGVQNISNPEEISEWIFRDDSFSDYKPGFEIRTTRRCSRCLLFHHFDQPDQYEGLVKTIEFNYSQEQDFSMLDSVILKGYCKKEDGTYSIKSLPPFEFGYQQHEWNTEVKDIHYQDLVHAPSGLAGSNYIFTDLYNEGLSGILFQQNTSWYYKNSLGNGQFEQAQEVISTPSFSAGSSFQLVDLDSSGNKSFASYSKPLNGYFELNTGVFKNFQELPELDFNDPNLRLIDLTNNGTVDIIISEESIFTWYPSKGSKGFEEHIDIGKEFDEELGPSIIFSDMEETIFTANMSGDGLTDIVRIRNSEVCYWPNLGFGQFGKKVTLDHCPTFEPSDQFDPKRIILSDISGTGTADICYLGQNKVWIWKNINGNSLSTEPFIIDPFPDNHPNTSVTVTDILGNGVMCLAWSSPLPSDSNAPLKYIDLMKSKKPYLMTSYKNNMGKEVHLEYTSSTKYYIEDKLAGKPWITQLHFPVHCISKTKIEDKTTGHSFSTEYTYHHGYYDSIDKEFRGFGLVESCDSESFENWLEIGNEIIEETLYQNPILTKSWFHLGAYFQDNQLNKKYEREYWYSQVRNEGTEVESIEKDTDFATIQDELGHEFTSNEWIEAHRACKGRLIRAEVFEKKTEDASKPIEKLLTPYSVTSSYCQVKLLQPQLNNLHAVFQVNELETISYNYEQNPDDPRISHEISCKFDQYGNVLEAASIGYPRLVIENSLPDRVKSEQAGTKIIYTKDQFTNDIITDKDYRLRLPSQSQTFELKNIPKANQYYESKDLDDILSNIKTQNIPYHLGEERISDNPSRRCIENIKTTYLKNDLRTPLPPNRIESLGLVFENYQQAYTQELAYQVFGNKMTPAILGAAGFIKGNGDYTWWIRSGKTNYLSEDEVAGDAKARFYMPIGFEDPHGAISRVVNDPYHLYIQDIENALGNRSFVDKFNFRLLVPQRVLDVNGNVSEVIHDELGMLKAIAVLGKGDEADNLEGFTEETMDQGKINELIHNDEPDLLITRGKELLGNATTRFIYDLDAYQRDQIPIVIGSIAREEHFKENADSPIQLGFEYLGGTGEAIMQKAQAEPGIAKTLNDNDEIIEIDTSPNLRWIGSGRVVLNNKNNPVKQYENYFSSSHHFENNKQIVAAGVTPIIYYDAPGRVIKTEMPDGTFSKVDFGPWKQAIYDVNDTVMDSRWYDERINRLIDNELIDAFRDPVKEKEAAEQATFHANTPGVIHTDSLGRPILSIEHNRNTVSQEDVFYETSVHLDIEGNAQAVIDARGNTVMAYRYDMLGNRIYQNSMDAGQRWLFVDITDKPFRTWDERNHEWRFTYDILQRPLNTTVIGGDGLDALNHIIDRVIYGDSLLNEDRSNEAELQGRNILEQPIRHYDTAGVVETLNYDFKEQPLATTRRLYSQYKEVVNWQEDRLTTNLESQSFTFSNKTDALGRITEQTAPDGSVINPGYNERGLLTSEEVKHPDNSVNVYIKSITYNERSQRHKIIYGNDVTTRHSYDPMTFRMNRLETLQFNGDSLQDLYYTYDPAGNITHIEDKCIPVIFFNNQKIEGISNYKYDALYRLIEASGRENDNTLIFTSQDNWDDRAFIKSLNPGDPMSTRQYTQMYRYDQVGNILQMKHVAAGNNWTRNYAYSTVNNRLLSTSVGSRTYRFPHHEKHGYMTEMPHLEAIGWNFKEELFYSVRQRRRDGGTPETTWYQYDAEGQRVRKITENEADPGAAPTKKNERIYIAGYELYKSQSGSNRGLERTSLSLMDEGHRFVMIDRETEPRTTLGIPTGRTTPKVTTRYQPHNHLGSISLELNESATVISYEEYHPYGTTAYQAKNASISAAVKRYRYTGMERDDETGLEYHTARYYIPFIGRWLIPDPIRIGDGVNIFEYCTSNPLVYNDFNGKQAEKFEGSIGFFTGIRFGTHENNLYIGAQIDSGFRSKIKGNKDFFLVGSFRIETFPHLTKWGRTSSVFQGWETNITVGAETGIDPYASIGWSTTIFKSKSFFEFSNQKTFGDRLSLTDQRIATPLLRIGNSRGENVEIRLPNDTSVVGGDSGDSYRSAGFELRINLSPIESSDKIENLSFGLKLDLVTGFVNNKDLSSENVDRGKGPFGTYKLKGPFKTLSQGALTAFADYRVTNLSNRFESGGSGKTIGGRIDLGLDSESIRNISQNLLVHDLLVDAPRVPLQDRNDEFYLNLDLYFYNSANSRFGSKH